MSGREEVFQQAMNEGHSAAWDQMWEKAATFYIQALDEVPNHPKVLTSLGLAMYEMQRYDESLQYYQRAASVSIEDPLPYEKVAQLSERIFGFAQGKSGLQAFGAQSGVGAHVGERHSQSRGRSCASRQCSTL